ncbi:nuclear transport factor 2 family protein [Nostocales cyanobacterium LEGE 12452]|nr:nuclear transport factor 2 family protein [Nostocales cyanobacterium LEGE 12452]
MKKIIIYFFVLASLFIHDSARSQQLARDKAIDRLLDNYTRSINAADTTIARSLFSSKQALSFIHPRGHEKGWLQIRDNFYVGTMGLLTGRKLVITESAVHQLDKNNAWVEFYWDFHATLKAGNQPLHTKGRESQLLVKENEDWKIVHIHYSGLPVSGNGQGF